MYHFFCKSQCYLCYFLLNKNWTCVTHRVLTNASVTLFYGFIFAEQSILAQNWLSSKQHLRIVWTWVMIFQMVSVITYFETCKCNSKFKQSNLRVNWLLHFPPANPCLPYFHPFPWDFCGKCTVKNASLTNSMVNPLESTSCQSNPLQDNSDASRGHES